jgi:cation:H+ antiporter
VVLLAIATNLPEIAITTSAAMSGDLGIATGNILGGIAIQTVVLAALDALGRRGQAPLTRRAASLAVVLEGALVVAVLAVVVMANRLPASLVVAGRLAPGDLLIAGLWVGGVRLVGAAGSNMPWQNQGTAPGGQQPPKGHSKTQMEQAATRQGVSTSRAAAAFTIAAGLTLVAGVALERSGEALAGRLGLSGVLFGSTILAAATALPEVSTGLASIRLGDDQLAVSDIFGGNAFLPVLFLLAGLLSGQAVLPRAQASDVYLTGLGILLTSVYIGGLIVRPRRRLLRMGADSLAVVLLYLVGVAGLVALSR